MSFGLLKISLPFLALAALCACVAKPSPITERISPQTYEAVLPYQFMSCSSSISGAEQGRIRGFLDSLGLTNQDRLVVSVPKNRLPLRDVERRKTLAQIFAAYPAKVSYMQDQDFRELPQSEPQGIIRVVRVHDVAADCLATETTGGCTTAHNLAVMIAHPADTFLPGKGNTYHPHSAADPGSLANGSVAGQ